MASANPTQPTKSQAAIKREINERKGTPGTEIFALASTVLGNKVAVKKYGSSNFNKTYIKGVVIQAFDGRKPGAKNVSWRIKARWEIPGHEGGQDYDIRRQDVYLEQPKANPETTIANFPDSIDHRDFPSKGSTTYKASASNAPPPPLPPLASAVSSAATVAAPRASSTAAPPPNTNKRDGTSVLTSRAEHTTPTFTALYAWRMLYKA